MTPEDVGQKFVKYLADDVLFDESRVPENADREWDPEDEFFPARDR